MALTLVVLVVAALGLVGCVESSEEAAQTPTGVPHGRPTAPKQTDSEGKTITAPASAPGGGGADDHRRRRDHRRWRWRRLRPRR